LVLNGNYCGLYFIGKIKEIETGGHRYLDLDVSAAIR
jgi:hypothetical protein